MLNNLTISQASKLLNEGKILSVDLVNFYFGRMNRYESDIQAFITADKQVSLSQARQSDERRASKNMKSQYDGVPIAIKDVLVTKEFRTTAGSKMLEDFIPPYDATVVKKMREAGMVLLGKTNMDEFAMGSSTENSAYWVTKNPWDLGRVPGGSSGGSAAAVAADLVTAAVGSDTGGSIRQPASLCGIYGLKPTYGSVSRYGLIAMASSLDQVGPMTKSIEDAKILYDLISGEDQNDATSKTNQLKKLQKKKCKKFTNANLQGLKVGLPKEYFGRGVDPKVAKLIESEVMSLQKLGATLVNISLPHSQYSLSVYYIIMPVEVASNLARYDGVRFGIKPNQIKNQPFDKLSFESESEGSSLRVEDRIDPERSRTGQKSKIKNYIDEIKQIRTVGFGPEVKRRIILGTFASSVGYAAKYYRQAQKVRTLVRQDFDLAFEKIDLIAGPVSPTPAFPIGEKVDDPLAMYLSDIFTIPVNLAGLPAISIPCGYTQEGENGQEGVKGVKKLPVGLQLVAPQFHEELLFDVGRAYEQAIGYKFISPLS